MKLVIAGSRNLNLSVRVIRRELNNHIQLTSVTEIVSGTARGIDKCGEVYADTYNIPIKRFPADWNNHGKAAGMIRNREMAKYGDTLFLIWDGESRGSSNMKKEMTRLGKPVYEFIIKEVENEL